jgi:hypothetical protein
MVMSYFGSPTFFKYERRESDKDDTVVQHVTRREDGAAIEDFRGLAVQDAAFPNTVEPPGKAEEGHSSAIAVEKALREAVQPPQAQQAKSKQSIPAAQLKSDAEAVVPGQSLAGGLRPLLNPQTSGNLLQRSSILNQPKSHSKESSQIKADSAKAVPSHLHDNDTKTDAVNTGDNDTKTDAVNTGAAETQVLLSRAEQFARVVSTAGVRSFFTPFVTNAQQWASSAAATAQTHSLANEGTPFIHNMHDWAYYQTAEHGRAMQLTTELWRPSVDRVAEAIHIQPTTGIITGASTAVVVPRTNAASSSSQVRHHTVNRKSIGIESSSYPLTQIASQQAQGQGTDETSDTIGKIAADHSEEQSQASKNPKFNRKIKLAATVKGDSKARGEFVARGGKMTNAVHRKKATFVKLAAEQALESRPSAAEQSFEHKFEYAIEHPDYEAAAAMSQNLGDSSRLKHTIHLPKGEMQLAQKMAKNGLAKAKAQKHFLKPYPSHTSALLDGDPTVLLWFLLKAFSSMDGHHLMQPFMVQAKGLMRSKASPVPQGCQVFQEQSVRLV